MIMFKSPKINIFLLTLLILIVFSVLGTSDILNFKELLLVEGFTTETTNSNNYNARAGSVTTDDGNTYYAAQGPRGNVVYGQTNNQDNNPNNYNARAGSVTTDDGTTYYAAQGPRGNVVYGQTNTNEYGIYYPTDTPYNDAPITINDPYIPPNQNNYIKKTQIVPPVCPACPYPPPQASKLDQNGQPIMDSNTETMNNTTSNSSNLSSSSCNMDKMVEQIKKEHCPPCPACERCPEPSFECKKVPNYKSSASNDYLPLPVLNDFSNFD